MTRTQGYDRVATEEIEELGTESSQTENGLTVPGTGKLPIEPPEYGIAVDNEATDFDEEMQMEDLSPPNEPWSSKLRRLKDKINVHVVQRVQKNVIYPLTTISEIASEKIDLHLSKIGNPLILRRFFYITLMSIITYVVIASGLLSNDHTIGSKGMFADHHVFLQYARKSVDLSKMERDLEYISSMPHMSGTKGDAAIRQYIQNSFTNNGLKSVMEREYSAYFNYFESAKLTLYTSNNKEVEIKLDQKNWNPSSTTGELKITNIIYANKGTLSDLQKLKDENLFDSDFILLMNYGKLVSEQILAAEKYGAKGILFISKYREDNKNLIQSRPVALTQYWPGDALTPGWTGEVIRPLDPDTVMVLPRIPTIPLSHNQANKILELLSNSGVKFDNGKFSGISGDVRADMSVKNTVRQRHPVNNIIGKIEGKDQNDKAIIIGASRNSVGKGASYPNFGTMLLLSLVQTFEEIKYKYDWKPLRNIYFISFGGNEFNNAGATEFIEENLFHLKNEVYSFIDITQLGITSETRKLNVQTHPLLQKFFEDDNNKMKFDVKVSNVHQYGDWTPFLANGIPVSIFSSEDILEGTPLMETSEDTFDIYSKLLEDTQNKSLATDILMYVLQATLKIVDEPLLTFDLYTYCNIMNEIVKKLSDKHKDNLDFKELKIAFAKWKFNESEWSSWVRSWNNIVMSHDSGLEPSLLSLHRWNWNKRLSNVSSTQVYANGIRKRPFYKNILFGPPLWTQDLDEDYAWTFPGIRDAIYERNWNAAQEQIDIVSSVLKRSANTFLEGNSNYIA